MPTKTIQQLEFIKKIDTANKHPHRGRHLFLYKENGFLWVNAPNPLGSGDLFTATLMKPKSVMLSNMVDILVRNEIVEEVFNQLNEDYMIEYLIWKMEI